MARADKIFTILFFTGLIAVLLWRIAPASPRLNTSATPANTFDLGPAYLLSALPIHRHGDDHAPDASYGGAELV